MTEEEQLEKMRDIAFGIRITALAAINALIRAHPNPEILEHELHVHYEQALDYVVNEPVSDQVREAFLISWQRLRDGFTHES